GDVKYHLGATGVRKTPSGKQIRLHLNSNPSHLEAVVPVAMGRVRAKLTRAGDPSGRAVLPVLLHGDSAFAGQGITAEALNLTGLPGYGIGGAVHVVVNNLIGFTTEPGAYGATRYATDLAKRLPIPILHVNAERPEAVVRAARFAMAFRERFRDDVVIDLIGYRKHGHSEVDDPTVTQPLLYRRIQEMPPVWRGWAQRIGVDEATIEARAEAFREQLRDA